MSSVFMRASSTCTVRARVGRDCEKRRDVDTRAAELLDSMVRDEVSRYHQHHHRCTEVLSRWASLAPCPFRAARQPPSSPAALGFLQCGGGGAESVCV